MNQVFFLNAREYVYTLEHSTLLYICNMEAYEQKKIFSLYGQSES